jgi:CheY-like chemotaxis protein
VPGFSKLLLIAESPVFRKVLAGILSAHADQVIEAASAREGRRRIAEHADISLVLSEVAMRDGSGFQLLEYVGSLGDPKPRVILLTARPAQEEAERAFHMGAIGYLGKPISLQEIHRLWKERTGPVRETARRVRSLGRALLIDAADGEPREDDVCHLAWEIRNVSYTGAFLETRAPLPVGTRFRLALDLESARGQVDAEVVRVQEPSWRCAGGVGIAFRDFGAGTEKLLFDYIAGATKNLDGRTAPLLKRSLTASS